MKAAIAHLENILETLQNNEPINRAEGNTEQADLEAVNASEIRQALTVLKAADAGPIWPAPTAAKVCCKDPPPPGPPVNPPPRWLSNPLPPKPQG